jgi:hypothetical protein
MDGLVTHTSHTSTLGGFLYSGLRFVSLASLLLLALTSTGGQLTSTAVSASSIPPSVGVSVFMPISAMGSEYPVQEAASDIFAPSNYIQVVRIATGSIPAQVINALFFFEGSFRQDEYEAMGFPCQRLVADSPITIGINASSPNPAPGGVILSDATHYPVHDWFHGVKCIRSIHPIIRSSENRTLNMMWLDESGGNPVAPLWDDAVDPGTPVWTD